VEGLVLLQSQPDNQPPEEPAQATIVPPQKKSESADAASENWDPRLP
jgi:hypothetical protein